MIAQAAPRAAEAMAALVAALPGPRADAWLTIGLPVDRGPHGQDLLRAALLAAERCRGLAFAWVDDGPSAAGGAAAAARLLAEGVRLAVGHFHSGSALAAAPLYGAADALLLAPGSSHPALTEAGAGRCLRLCGRDDQQAALFAATLAAAPGTPVLLIEDAVHGRSLGEAIAAALDAAGRPAWLALSGTAAAFGAIPDGPVALAGRQGFARALLPRVGARPLVLLGDDCLAPEVLAVAAHYCPGARIAAIAGEADAADRARRQCRARFGIAPGAYFAGSLAAFDLLVAAAERVGPDPAALAAALGTRRWPTALGPIAFDAAGEPQGLRWCWHRAGAAAGEG